MNNGIKPTRLWRLTGMKHFKRNLRDRHEGVPHPHDQRERIPFFHFLAFALASMFGTAYAFGGFSPPKPLSTIVRPAGVCDPPPKKKCPRTFKGPPCPPEQPPTSPNPCEPPPKK